MNKEKIAGTADRCMEYLQYLLILFIPISNAAIEIIFMISLVLFLIKKSIQPDFSFLKDYCYFFLSLFLFFSALSLINSDIYLIKGVKAMVCKWAEYLGILVIAADTINTTKRLRNAFLALLAASGLIAVDALFQKIFGFDFLRFKPMPKGDWRVAASFKSGNGLAAYLAPNLILAQVSLFFIPKGKKIKFALLFLSALLIVAFVLTGCRGAWLGYLAGIILFVFLTKKIKGALTVAAIFIILILLTPLSRERALSTFHHGGDGYRSALNSISWSMINRSPFLGQGVGTYMDHFKAYAPAELGIQYAHNTFLQIWAECGIFSLLSFILFLLAVLLPGARLYRKRGNFLILGLVCAAFGLITHSAFETQLYSLQLAAFFWLFMGIAIAAIRLEAK